LRVRNFGGIKRGGKKLKKSYRKKDVEMQKNKCRLRMGQKTGSRIRGRRNGVLVMEVKLKASGQRE